MTLKSKEHYELLAQFEKEFGDFKLGREPKRLWKRGIIYTDGVINRMFDAYRRGYSLGKAISSNGH